MHHSSIMRIGLRLVLFTIAFLVLGATALTLWAHTLRADEETVWGVDFSESQATYLGLDPLETYHAIIHDLGAKRIKIHINWNATEAVEHQFDFTSLDAEVREAEANNVKLILVVGMKTGRWPECHTPGWFANVTPADRDDEIIRYTTTIVGRYKNSKAVEYWQVENEPFIKFGTCPSWYYKTETSVLAAEVAAVRQMDPSRKIIISDSGELSSWTEAAKVGDIVGITTYRSSWNASQKTFGLNPYTFLSPDFYATKAAVIESYYNKPVISVELQAEPWASKGLAEASLEEQAKSMNPELFAENIAFAKQAGLGGYYFWGAEWWYWMKTKHNQPEIWNQAKELFTGVKQ
jgi:hypothetical protein